MPYQPVVFSVQNPGTIGGSGGQKTLLYDASGNPISSTSGALNVQIAGGSIALPAGAATAAKQPALGTAGTPSADVITVQGRTGMTPVSGQLYRLGSGDAVVPDRIGDLFISNSVTNTTPLTLFTAAGGLKFYVTSWIVAIDPATITTASGTAVFVLQNSAGPSNFVAIYFKPGTTSQTCVFTSPPGYFYKSPTVASSLIMATTNGWNGTVTVSLNYGFTAL